MKRSSVIVMGSPRCRAVSASTARIVCSNMMPSDGSAVVGEGEEVVVAVGAEVFEGPDRDDPVDRLVELLPAVEQHPFGAWTRRLIKEPLHVCLLVAAQSQTDDVDVVAFDSADHGGAPATPDVEQRHAWLQTQLAQRQIDLGDLRVLERHVLAIEVGAAVGLRRIEKQPKELIGQVVVRLYVLEVGLQGLRRVRRVGHHQFLSSSARHGDLSEGQTGGLPGAVTATASVPGPGGGQSSARPGPLRSVRSARPRPLPDRASRRSMTTGIDGIRINAGPSVQRCCR